ncbi:DUF6973 domain-containing protein [Deinococcus arcticus]|uniref:DUF6973 domain-containing protein n=1 Tax=Deinococcus arcticus TaxID=2136176 RepID=UPI0011B24A27|nr:hypothetical protein [Deinococcus arcticus]
MNVRTTALSVLLITALASCGTQVLPQTDTALPAEVLAQPDTYLNQPVNVTPEKIEMVKAIWSMTPEATKALVATLEAAPEHAQLGLLQQRLNEEKALGALGSYPGGLTWEEFKLCSAHPIKCNKTKGYADDALAEAGRQFRDGAYLGRADAFRHAFWNALMVSGIDYGWAVDFATAHESEAPSGNDKTMDLRNNATGRLASGAGVARSTLVSRIRSKVLTGATYCLRREVKSGALITTNSTPCANR